MTPTPRRSGREPYPQNLVNSVNGWHSWCPGGGAPGRGVPIRVIDVLVKPFALSGRHRGAGSVTEKLSSGIAERVRRRRGRDEEPDGKG